MVCFPQTFVTHTAFLFWITGKVASGCVFPIKPPSCPVVEPPPSPFPYTNLSQLV